MTEAKDTNHRLQVLSGSSARVVQMVLGFLATVYFARILPKEEFGLYFLVLSVVTLVDGPLTGWSQAAQKRFSEVESKRGEIVGAVIIGVAVGSVVYLGLFYLLDDVIPGEFVMFAILFPVLVGSNATMGLVTASGRVGARGWIDTGRTIIRISLQVALLGLGALGLVLGMTTAALLTIPISLWIVGYTPQIPSRETLSSMWGFGQYTVIGGVVYKIGNEVDKVMLGFIVGTGIVSTYETSYRLTMPALLATTAIAMGLMPRISNIRDHGGEVAPHVSRNLAFASILSIPIFFGALGLGDLIPQTVFGSKYSDAGWFLIGLALVRVFETQTAPMSSIVKGMDRPDLSVSIAVVTAIINVALGILLVFEIGAIGVVVATVVATGFRYVALAGTVRHLIPDSSIFPRQIGEQVVAGSVMYLVIVTATQVRPLTNSIEILLTVGLGGSIYLAVMLFSPEFRRLIREVAIERVI